MERHFRGNGAGMLAWWWSFGFCSGCYDGGQRVKPLPGLLGVGVRRGGRGCAGGRFRHRLSPVCGFVVRSAGSVAYPVLISNSASSFHITALSYHRQSHRRPFNPPRGSEHARIICTNAGRPFTLARPVGSQSPCQAAVWPMVATAVSFAAGSLCHAGAFAFGAAVPGRHHIGLLVLAQ